MHIMFVNMYTNITVYLFCEKQSNAYFLVKKKINFFLCLEIILEIKFCQDYVRLPL